VRINTIKIGRVGDARSRCRCRRRRRWAVVSRPTLTCWINERRWPRGCCENRPTLDPPDRIRVHPFARFRRLMRSGGVYAAIRQGPKLLPLMGEKCFLFPVFSKMIRCETGGVTLRFKGARDVKVVQKVFRSAV
jgi:hypothetical protein